MHDTAVSIQVQMPSTNFNFHLEITNATSLDLFMRERASFRFITGILLHLGHCHTGPQVWKLPRHIQQRFRWGFCILWRAFLLWKRLWWLWKEEWKQRAHQQGIKPRDILQGPQSAHPSPLVGAHHPPVPYSWDQGPKAWLLVFWRNECCKQQGHVSTTSNSFCLRQRCNSAGQFLQWNCREIFLWWIFSCLCEGEKELLLHLALYAYISLRSLNLYL